MSSSVPEPFDALDRAEIGAALDNLSRATVAVVGDFCLDGYWMIDRSASEASVETGLKTEPVRTQRYSPGGAGNVVMNLLALGVHKIYPVGILGDDPFGRELRRLMTCARVDDAGLIQQPEDWATHAYLKPFVQDQEISRIDHGNFNRLSPAAEDRLFTILEDIVQRVSVVLVNHQVAGSMHDSESFRRRLSAMMTRHPGVCFIIDSRGYHESYLHAVHKLNEREVMRACGVEMGPEETVSLDHLVARAGALSQQWRAPLVVTRGERGCLVSSRGVTRQIFGIQLPGRSDPVGAGDTFVSTLAAISSTGTNLEAAAFVANIAAAVTAQKLRQTGTALPGEILELGSQADYACRPELAESPHRARHYGDTEIEIVGDPPAGLNIRHAIFDHDGTISTLREGWERIMEPMMEKAVLGRHFETADGNLCRRVRDRVRDFIARTTGIQTIAQMHGLADLVNEFGLVPPEDIRSPAEYKAVYNEELKALVGRRLCKLDRGELAIGDFTVKGAVPFLRALKKAGVRLYLASGTDEADVQQEAERLGYAEVFDGGIFGSIGQVAQDAKKMVIERILRDIGSERGQLIAFGDGPVEVRETVRRGSYAVGVASDEVRRFGLNLEKRARLIRSGAHVVVPDFSQWESLWTLLRLAKPEPR